jgi:Na+/H+-translocating membrane pyrophosphatase
MQEIARRVGPEAAEYWMKQQTWMRRDKALFAAMVVCALLEAVFIRTPWFFLGGAMLCLAVGSACSAAAIVNLIRYQRAAEIALGPPMRAFGRNVIPPTSSEQYLAWCARRNLPPYPFDTQES